MPMMTLTLFAPVFPFSFPLLDFGMWNGNDLCGEPFETIKRRFWLCLLGRCRQGARYAVDRRLANSQSESSCLTETLIAYVKQSTPNTTNPAAISGSYLSAAGKI